MSGYIVASGSWYDLNTYACEEEQKEKCKTDFFFF